MSQINFIFGSNGTGKTTISRVIADDDGFPTCKVTWKDGTKLQKELLNARVAINIQRLARKRKEPSRIVELESIDNVVNAITTQVDATNALVAGHNKMVAIFEESGHSAHYKMIMGAAFEESVIE
ncbi:hypothetical protein GALL_462220 [mine drainage metagenome]|uniref:ATPase AAA-type core domain-containing protein n=1 Tax=mine drainage metagenome TaxID=410659 RepID=A0A1J5Q3W3_9ZZZZ